MFFSRVFPADRANAHSTEEFAGAGNENDFLPKNIDIKKCL